LTLSVAHGRSLQWPAPRAHLVENLQSAAARGRLARITPELSFEILTGLLLQVMRSAAEQRLSPAQAAAVGGGDIARDRR
jgi:hypothetical protein